MPKRSKYPGLRSHSWKTAGGEVRTAYYYDRRAEGRPDEKLGTDYAEALRKWHELHFDRPREAGTLEEAFRAWEIEVLPTYRQTTRRDYGLCLTQLRPVFGGAAWADITMPTLKAYLSKRSGKTRANRELAVLSIVWNWARSTDRGDGEPYTAKPFPAAGMERSRWKNKEQAREFEVTPALFSAVYKHADQVLRDAMDIASATGLRLTDVVSVGIPSDGILRGAASKTGKRFAIVVSDSPTLQPLMLRRQSYRAGHLMLLSTPNSMVSLRMLSERWIKARAKAIADRDNRKLVPDLKRMILRDMRKLAAAEAVDLRAAAELLQHDDPRLTAKHYRQAATPRKSVR